MAIQQEKPQFRARAWKSFITSSWLTAIWEWFLGLAGRAVQLVLFITVMYNLVSTYPGFKAPWAGLDIMSFILQNVALDVGSFGLPKLAAQAEKDGNAEGAENARKVAKALFLILISNLIWGGVEHVFPGIPEALKTVAGLGFVIIRAYYAAEYMKVIHGLDKHEEQVQGAGVQGQPVVSTEVQALQTEVQALTREVQSLVQQVSSVQVQGQGGAMSEGHLAPVGVQEQISEMQDDISEVQDQVQGQLAEVLAQLARVQGGAMLPTVVGVQEGATSGVQGASELNAPRQSRCKVQPGGATSGVQQASCETRVQGARVQEVQVKGATSGVQGATSESQVQQPASVEVQGATDEGQLVQHNTEPLHLPVDLQVQGSATPSGYRDAIFAYVLQEVQRTGKEPSVNEIRVGVGCGERTVKSYRAAAIAKAREAVVYAE